MIAAVMHIYTDPESSLRHRQGTKKSEVKDLHKPGKGCDGDNGLSCPFPIQPQCY